MSNQKRVAIYTRQVPPFRIGEVLDLYNEDKWTQFDRLIEQSKGKVDAMAVAFPEILGDSYLELMVNLSKLASAGLEVMIKDPSPSIHKL